MSKNRILNYILQRKECYENILRLSGEPYSKYFLSCSTLKTTRKLKENCKKKLDRSLPQGFYEESCHWRRGHLVVELSCKLLVLLLFLSTSALVDLQAVDLAFIFSENLNTNLQHE